MRYFKATLNFESLKNLYTIDSSVGELPASTDVIIRTSSSAEKYFICEFIGNVSAINPDFIEQLNNMPIYSSVFENLVSIGYCPCFKDLLGSIVYVRGTNEPKKIVSINERNVELCDTYLSEYESINTEYVKPYDVDWGYVLTGKQVKIIDRPSSWDNVNSSDTGKTAYIDTVDKNTGEIVVSCSWSDGKDRDGRVFIDDVILVPEIKPNSMCCFKTVDEFMAEYGDRAVSYMNEYCYMKELMGDKYFYVINTDPSETDVEGVKWTGIKSVNNKFIKAARVLKTNYDNYSQIRAGDHIWNNEDYCEGQVVFNLGTISLVEFPEMYTGYTTFYGVGTKGRKYGWIYNRNLYFRHRGYFDCGVKMDIDNLNGVTSFLTSINVTAPKDFVVGDKVVIKDWDEMIAEFSSNDKYEPCTWCRFTNTMKQFCGKSCVIKNITSRGIVELGNWEDDVNPNGYVFSLDMIKTDNGEKTSSVITISQRDLDNILTSNSLSVKPFSTDIIENGDIVISQSGNFYCAIVDDMHSYLQTIGREEVERYEIESMKQQIVCVLDIARCIELDYALSRNQYTIKYVRNPKIRIEDIEIKLGKKIIVTGE